MIYVPDACLIKRHDSNKYKFYLYKDFKFQISYVSVEVISFYYKQREIMRWEGNTITIFRGYSWNGCSPKIKIGRRWFGTPDFKQTLEASLIHDAFCQFLHTTHFPLTRSQVDVYFLQTLLANKFKLSTLYYNSVRLFAATIAKLFKRNCDKITSSVRYYII